MILVTHGKQRNKCTLFHPRFPIYIYVINMYKVCVVKIAVRITGCHNRVIRRWHDAGAILAEIRCRAFVPHRADDSAHPSALQKRFVTFLCFQIFFAPFCMGALLCYMSMRNTHSGDFCELMYNSFPFNLSPIILICFTHSP